MWADLINKEKIHRVLWCALYMAVTVALQTTVFAHIALFGVLHRHLTPEEVEHIAQELYRGEGGLDSAVPADEIRRQIQATVHEKPAESDVRRVAARLAKGGWPLVPVKELND